MLLMRNAVDGPSPHPLTGTGPRPTTLGGLAAADGSLTEYEKGDVLCGGDALRNSLPVD